MAVSEANIVIGQDIHTFHMPETFLAIVAFRFQGSAQGGKCLQLRLVGEQFGDDFSGDNFLGNDMARLVENG